MPESNAILKAIEATHAASLDETLWPDALRRIAALFGAVGATLEDFGKQPFGLRYLRTAGLPPQAETDYLAHYQRHNPRAAYAFRNLSKPILCDYVLIDERAMDRDAYYTKYLKSLELRYFMSGQIMDTPQAQAIVSIQRTRRQGHVAQAEIELMRRLLPHLRQAYDVSLRLRHTGARATELEAALDWLADGAALVRRDGTVVAANSKFQELVRRGDGIGIRKGFLEFTSGAAAAQIGRATHDAAQIADSLAMVQPDFLLARGNDAPPYLVSVRPLARSGRRDGAVAFIFVRDPASKDRETISLLRSLYGLTEAEAAIAGALSAGLSRVAYARAHAVSLNTVYTHLRRIKEKTSSRRMPELIRKINDLKAPLRPK